MKAAIINKFGKPEVLQIEEISVPVIANNEILIQLKASSVNPVDWKHRLGNHKYILGSGFPIVLGYDAAGIVEKTGKNISKFIKGDRVYSCVNRKYGGAYAEFAASTEDTLAKIPDKLSFEEAAAIPLAAVTALQGLRDKGKIKTGDKVLINGAASGVGHFAVQIAKYFKANITAVCSSRHNEMMTLLKPDVHIDYNDINIKSLNEKFDIIFDVIGSESFRSLKHLLKPGGRYITTLPRPKVLAHKLLSLFTRGKKAITFLMKSKGTDLEFINQLIEQDKFRVIIDKVYSLEDIQQAHIHSESGNVEGKIVVRI